MSGEGGSANYSKQGRGSRKRWRRRGKKRGRCEERWGRGAPVFSLKLTVFSEEDGCIISAEK